MKYSLLMALMESNSSMSWMREGGYEDYSPKPNYGYNPPALRSEYRQEPPRAPESKLRRAGKVAAVGAAGLMGAGALGGAYRGYKWRLKNTDKDMAARVLRIEKELPGSAFGKGKGKVISMARDVALEKIKKVADNHPGYPKAMLRGAIAGARHPIAALKTAGKYLYKGTIGRWDN